MAKCEICGQTNFLIKTGDTVLCVTCFEKKSPFIDEIWRIINGAIIDNMIWVDFDAVERRRKAEKHGDSVQWNEMS